MVVTWQELSRESGPICLTMPSNLLLGTRWIALTLVILVLGLVLMFAPPLLMPQEIVHEDVVSAGNDYTTTASEQLDPGDYEVWISESFFSFFSGTSVVDVRDSGGASVYVDIHYGDKDRRVDGTDCVLVAEFDIDTSDTYFIEVQAPLSTLWTGSAKVYVAEARAPSYAVMQWSGFLFLCVGIALLIAIAFKRVMMKMDEDRAAEQARRPPPRPAYPYQYPPPQYPPPNYPPPQYPQQRPPPGPPPGY